ncbi:hypothetical protein H1C71_035624 [Ictidomys tridecemlineatus]|nr:hypothetical protein H1C71_035624 [Ictidomys tridecemlineatus]
MQMSGEDLSTSYPVTATSLRPICIYSLTWAFFPNLAQWCTPVIPAARGGCGRRIASSRPASATLWSPVSKRFVKTELTSGRPLGNNNTEGSGTPRQAQMPAGDTKSEHPAQDGPCCSSRPGMEQLCGWAGSAAPSHIGLL